MSAGGWRYPAALGVAIVLLVSGALIAFSALTPDTPLIVQDSPEPTAVMPRATVYAATSAVQVPPAQPDAPAAVSASPPEAVPAPAPTLAPPRRRQSTPTQVASAPAPTPAPEVSPPVVAAPAPAPTSQPPAVQHDTDSLPLVKRAAAAAAESGDSVQAAVLWGKAAALAPNDTTLQRLHAEALAWSGDTRSALQVYDALAASHPSPALLRARASVKVKAGDLSGAIADLSAVEEGAPTTAGQVLLGDLHRWSGHRDASRYAYRRALALSPGTAGALTGLADLRRTARRDLPWDVDEGTTASWNTIDDNSGFQTTAFKVLHGVPFGFRRQTLALIEVEARRVDTSPVLAGTLPRIDVWAGALGVAHRSDDMRLSAKLGVADFREGSQVATWQAGAEWRPEATTLSAQIARTPAFETLRAGTTLTGDTVLTAISSALTFSRQLTNRMELWSRAELLSLQDDNQRLSAQMALRASLGAGWSMMYSGGWIAFDQSALAYWSPHWYTLHGVGLEYRMLQPNGFYLTAQALPGIAWFEQGLPGGGVERDRAMQWQLVGEAGWRRAHWELTFASAFGRDRGGVYQAGTGLVRMRYRW